MKKFLNVMLYVFAVLYPIMVFSFLVIFKLPVRILSLCVIILGFAFFLCVTGTQKKDGKKHSIDWKPLLSSILLLAAGIGCFFTNQILFLKLYSVTISLLFLILFGSTLFIKPTIIFRFATLSDKAITGSRFQGKIEKYCRNITIIWCCFFILNGTLSVVTAFSQNLFKLTEEQANTVWSVYNGGLSYILMGLLFLIEYIFRINYNKKIPRPFPISEYNHFSRKLNHVMGCTRGQEKTASKSWKDFLQETAVLRKYFSSCHEEKFILNINDNWYFLICLVSLLQTSKTPVLILEIDSQEGTVLTDKNMEELLNADTKISSKEIETLPKIDNEKATIFIDGKPETLKNLEAETIAEINNVYTKFIPQKNTLELTNQDINNHLRQVLFSFTLGLKFYR